MRITRHAKIRIYWRNLSDDELAAALAGRVIVLRNGDHMHYDRHSRCAVIINPHKDLIITAYRLKPKQIKHYSSYERVG